MHTDDIVGGQSDDNIGIDTDDNVGDHNDDNVGDQSDKAGGQNDDNVGIHTDDNVSGNIDDNVGDDVYDDDVDDGDTLDMCTAAGGTPLTNGKLMDVRHVLNAIFKSKPLAAVPPGLKENVYFVVDNSDITTRRNQGNCSQFFDDCGAWNSNDTSPHTLVWMQASGQCPRVVFRNNLYCLMRRVSGEKKPVPIDPQPDILVKSRIWKKLACN